MKQGEKKKLTLLVYDNDIFLYNPNLNFKACVLTFIRNG